MNSCEYQKAYNYVKNYQQNSFRQGCCCSGRNLVGPTGPTGPTVNPKKWHNLFFQNLGCQLIL